MRFELDPQATTPQFEQVRSQVVDAVREGRLAPGAKLPTVRALAGELSLAVNTIAKAYRELEDDGVIVTRGRNGSFVAGTGDVVHQMAQAAATTYAETVRRLGLPPEEAQAIVTAALAVPRNSP